MGSKRYLLNTIIGVLLIVATSFAAIISLIHFKYYAGVIASGFAIVIEVVLLIKYLNTTNRKIASFLHAIQNDDTSISFPEINNDKAVNDVYKSLNHVVGILQKTKIESEVREQLFLSMIEHSSTGFISIDEHGDFEIMNQTARGMLDVEHTSNLTRLKQEFPELHKLLMQLKPRQVKSCQITKKNTSTILQVSSSIIKFKEKQLTLVSILDIKKEIESKELESWQKLIRIMNHEIMNSIAPITSVSKSLLPIFLKNGEPVTTLELSEKKICDTINGLEVIESMSSGLNNFVNHYRRLSQIPKPAIKQIDVNKWLQNLPVICSNFLETNNADFEIKNQSKVSGLMADEGLLNQVILNLIKNAAEAPILTKKKKIIISIEPSFNSSAIIKVINNGEPIDSEIQDKIFIPFFTTKKSGAGIGLFISRQIINLHNGTLSLITNENRETVFRVEI